MPAPFHRSLRSLAADKAHRLRWGLCIAALLGGLWSVWFFLFHISIRAVSSEARVEVEVAAHPIESAVDGEVAFSRLALDNWVEQGAVLVQLDTRALEIDLATHRARLASQEAQLGPIEREMDAMTRALEDHGQAARAQVAEARARHQGASALAQFARTEVERSSALQDRAFVSAADLARTTAEEQVQRFTAESLQVAVARIEAESRIKRNEIETALARLAREVAVLRGQVAQERLACEALQHDIASRSIRASVSGKLGEISVLRSGSFISKGRRLGAVVPPGKLQVTADFAPAMALGRVRPGQPARLRLDGFPWLEYGTLPLVVSSVGSEVREGKVRVEFRIQGRAPAAISMQHGLPGSVEVEVERALPAELVVRAAGRMLEHSWHRAPADL